MHAFLIPGMRLLERFGFARKFQLLFLLFMLPQVFSLWLIGDEYHEQFTSIGNEQAGGVQLQALDAFDVRLMHQRDLAARWKAVDLTRNRTPAAQAVMDRFSAGVAPLRESVEQMSKVFASTGASPGILDHLHSLQAALTKLDADTQAGLGWWPDGYDLFTAALQQSQQLRTQIATDSTLILTPWLEPFLLSQLATQQAPELAERIGRLSSVGETTVVSGQFSLQSRLQMRDLRSRMGDARDQLVASGALLDSKLSPALSGWSTQYKTTLQKLDAGLKTLDDGLFAGSVTLTADQFETTLDGMQAGMNDLRASSLLSLDKRLEQYRAAAVRTVMLAAIGVGVMLVLAVYLFVCLQYSIRRSAKGITTLAEALRDGDLRTQVTVHGRDELAAISRALNTSVVQLRGSLQGVDRETGNLGGAVLTLNGEARDSLAAVEAQQLQISQIASATVQMASTAQQVADSCEQATREADQTRGIAERGSRDSEGTTTSIRQLNDRLGSTASALGRLHEQTREINKVVDVIRGIAEQTNLLALNAAIEAARAGDQGRGFAVVADEVRSLSQRTQASTQQIVKTVDSLQQTVGEAVTLMQAACGQAETDAESVTALGDRLVEIATAVQRVSSTLGQIASAVEQQAATADEVSDNLQQVDQAAGRLLDGARAVHRAADTLNSGSQALSENTARFRLV